MPAASRPDLEKRVLAGRAENEDAVVLSVPPNVALVQTADVLAPIVNDAYAFGRIAAANAFSDVYAMGGTPWSAINLAFFPPELAENDPEGIMQSVLQGGLDAMFEAGAVPAGGHTVQDKELKYGLSVTGIIDPSRLARNDGLIPGQRLLLTKPLGVGILATAVKAGWEKAEESEAAITSWCGRLNSTGAKVIRELALTAATDVTGFGLGGHSLEMARASHVCVTLWTKALPLLPNVIEYALDGLIPSGSHANRCHCAAQTLRASDVDETLESIVFDAQTSGGLLLAVPEDKLSQAKEMLLAAGDLACEVGFVDEERKDGKALILC